MFEEALLTNSFSSFSKYSKSKKTLKNKNSLKIQNLDLLADRIHIHQSAKTLMIPIK